MEITSHNLYTREGIIYIDARLESIGRVRFSTKLKATDENMAKVLLEVKDRIYAFLRHEEKPKAQRITLKSIGERFIDEQCAHLKNQTLIKYRSNLNDLISAFGSKDVRLITQKELNAYARQDTQSYKIGFLNRLVSYMRDLNLTTLHPIRTLVKATLKEESNILPLSLEETQRVLANAPSDIKPFLITAIFTGMRTGELLALTLKDCDFENQKIYVGKSKEQSSAITSTKTKQSRYIDMLDIVKSTLLALKSEKHLKENDVLFPFDNPTLRLRWYALLESLGLSKRALYQTRHTFATLMLTQKEEVLWISAMLGHKSLATTFTYYVKYIPSDVKRAKFVDSAFGHLM